jgi:hypothetical protein
MDCNQSHAPRARIIKRYYTVARPAQPQPQPTRHPLVKPWPKCQCGRKLTPTAHGYACLRCDCVVDVK